MLSATVDLDIFAKAEVIKARQIKGVERLHASELRLEGVIEISNYLISIQSKYQPRFDIVIIEKADHAIMSFFDQVFDQGMNPAMLWSGYRTPLRYLLQANVACLFDKDLIKRAWKARIDTNNQSAEAELVYVCSELVSRLSKLPDPFSRQVIGDALNWAIHNPSELAYNCKTTKDVHSVTPNIIGFQAVMHGIASRLDNPQSASSIIVDQQAQFNRSQESVAEFYAKTRNVDWAVGPGLPKIDLLNMPSVPITCKPGKESIGLELVDCYLWIFKRFFEGKDLPAQLYPIIYSQLQMKPQIMSLDSLTEKWSDYFNNLPDPTDYTEDKIRAAKEWMAREEEIRLRE
ncbi:MAG: hypothetical protein WA902_05315 [Thermosynechococcaceae cyanobacterium]